MSISWLTEAVHATPYRHAPNVVVAYPGVADWKKVYSPPGGFMMSRYDEMRRKHETEVTRILDFIVKRATGRAVLAAIAERPDVSVMILPFDFRPPMRGDQSTAAVTWPVQVPQLPGDDPRHRPENTYRARGKPGGPDADAYGTGTAADIYFSAALPRGFKNVLDQLLVHELLHASRVIKGLVNMIPLNEDYDNMEEFFGNVIENIYRSEGGSSPMTLRGIPFHPDVFLRVGFSVDARWMLKHLRQTQPTLFQALAAIPTRFNPIAQVAAEEAERKRRIDLRPPAGARPVPRP